jgi:hypothetical protein
MITSVTVFPANNAEVTFSGENKHNDPGRLVNKCIQYVKISCAKKLSP